jgi:hypothetical protein
MLRVRSLWALALLAAAVLALPALAADKVEKGFKPLLTGKDMSDFTLVLGNKTVKKSDTWTVEDGVIKCTGKPNGYFATKKPYRNFVLRFDFRYPERAGNSGYLMYITGPHKTWPKCIEVQGQYSQAGLIFAIGGAKGPDNRKSAAMKTAQEKARKPHKEWNSMEIISQDGKLISKLNGMQVGEGVYSLKEGSIGFQSEGTPIEFRNLRIKVTD